jgi:hypothetical protein
LPSTEPEICGDSGKGPSQLERGEKEMIEQDGEKEKKLKTITPNKGGSVIALEKTRELSGQNIVCVGRTRQSKE